MKPRMIDYNKDINGFSVDRTIEKFDTLHPDLEYDRESFRKFLEDYQLDCCSNIKTLEQRKRNNSIYKDIFSKLMNSYCSDNVQFSNIDFIDNLVRQYRKEPGNIILNSAIITILRIPNWPLYSDKELELLNKNKKPEDLGVLDTKTCPYNMEEVPLDLISAIDLVFDNVSDYIERTFVDQPIYLRNENGKKILFDKEDLKLAILKFRMMVAGKIEIPDKIIPIIRYYQDLKNSRLVSIYSKNKNGFQSDSFMETESGCPINNYRSILSILNQKVSLGRVSNTIGNYFVAESRYINDNMRKMIPIDLTKSGLKISMDCVNFSYGKGDAYKDRIVYILWTVIQDILGPTADYWSKLQENYGYELIGTTHQHERLNQLGPICKDGLGIDYTQYSDYLFRGVFHEIMTLIGFDKNQSKEICDLVSLPILHKDKIYPVRLASNMGAKMDFILITEANLYMYAISAIMLNKYSDHITVVGDDRWEVLLHRYYSEKEVYVKLQVACCFNCKLNPTKTTWMKRDGIFGGCHVWYNKFNLPSTGIAPSQLLKDFYMIKDYNSLINKIEDSGQTEIYDEDIIHNLISNSTSKELLLIGNRKFGYKDEEFDKFLSNAFCIPYQFGGLGYHIENLDPTYYAMPIFQNLLNILKSNQTSDFDRFVKAFNLEDSFITKSLNERKGAKHYRDLANLMIRLRSLTEPGMMTNEELQSIRKDLQKYFDLERRLENRGRSKSTKNRRGLEYDSDKLFRQEKSSKSVEVFNYRDDLMSKQLLMDYKNCKDKSMILKLLSYTAFMSKVNGSIDLYSNAFDSFWGLKTNEFPGRYIRLETKWNNRYSDICVTKKEIDDSPNRYNYIMIKDLLESTNLYSELKDILKTDLKNMAKEEFNNWVQEEAMKMLTSTKAKK